MDGLQDAIQKIFEWKEDENNLYLISEYLSYGSLYDKIKKEGFI